MTARKDLRRHLRQPLHEKVVVVWEDERGFRMDVRGTCKDASGFGLAVVLPDPIPAHTLVGVQVPKQRSRATGTVRYCKRDRLNYLVGLESTSGAPWPGIELPSRPTSR